MKRRLASTLVLVGLALAALGATSASAAPQVWKLRVFSEPTNFIPGQKGKYLLIATNVGSASTSAPVTITDTLDAGLTLQSITRRSTDPHTTVPYPCTQAGQTIECTSTDPVRPGFSLFIEVNVSVAALPDPTVVTNQAEVSGGGATSAANTRQTTVTTALPPFDFLPGEDGFSAPVIDAEGNAVSEAGSHPYASLVDLSFPTVERASTLVSAGHPRDTTVDLPPGMIGNPAATPVLCTEALLISELEPGCPPASAVGVATVTTQLLTGVEPNPSALFAMVPPPGVPAAFAFDAAGAGIFVHVNTSLRSDGDYGISGFSHDIIARDGNPAFGASIELWGDPSDEAHDYARGNCLYLGGFLNPGELPCEVDDQDEAFLTLPGNCSPQSNLYRAHSDSWEEPGIEREAAYESADLFGAAAPIEDCEGLEFEPDIKVRPTTNLADSPTGLDVDVHQPQELDFDTRATATLKDIKVTFPPGLSVNASSANGLGACTPTQIGLTSGVGEASAHFTKGPAGCPNESKLGTVEALSPLLPQRNAEHEVQRDVEGNAIPEPLHGSIFLAKPFENPFSSLIAVYVTIEDPKTGIFAKLAGKVEPDPTTGQLTTTFTDNPQLPVEDIKAHLFGGDRSGLQTPTTCGSHTTNAQLTPWSDPDGPATPDADSFQITANPAGGCPATGGQASNSPTLNAGTITPQAGTYSPFVFKLSRPDGSQRLSGLEATLPRGLSAKLAGVAQCTEAQIAAAAARSHPNEGALEQASPSCPAATQIGTVTAGAGAGPNPLYVQGHAYLAGPYKGAPLSFVFITPAVAGPFDLGVVVVRAAAYLDPTTVQARTVSDPFPQILQGIPLDLRSVALKVDRPNFTLNPTSCSQKEINTAVTSVFGQVAPLSQRFQVGGCSALPFKPKLTARLFGPIHRGGHPRLRAVLTAKPGEAGIARTVVALPKSEFIDQAHFRTICTRVQFAANQCPAGSVYGHVTAYTPLLDFPLEGAVYLRSSSHKLPDAVFALRGPPSLPVAIDAVGRVDSVNGGIRTSFEALPDAPITKVVLSMQGGKKGLFQNSTNICKGLHRMSVKMDGQNGKTYDTTPVLRAQCPKKGKGKGKPRR
jgi:uncharacterized repeat protein (TIGR01451 family)